MFKYSSRYLLTLYENKSMMNINNQYIETQRDVET